MALTLRLVRALESEILSIPDNCILPGTTHPSLPYVVVGDEAFPLCYVHIEEEICQVMKSESLYLYSVYVYLYELCIEDKAIFKYRLSHGHRVIENYFGILVAYGVPFVTSFHVTTITAIPCVGAEQELCALGIGWQS